MSGRSLAPEDAAGPAAPVDVSGERSFLGHPRGLLVLFATQGCHAFALYGLESILVLALAGSLLRPGRADGIVGLGALGRLLGWAGTGSAGIDGRAAMLAGLFAALAFMAPMVGGVVADRVLGHVRAVVLGLGCYFVGLALLVARPLLLVGLGLALVGIGLAGALNAQLGALYATNDPRRSNGFQLYSCATCIAAIFAPIVCGTLGERYDWSVGFAAASLGAGGALAAYLIGRGKLRSAGGGDDRDGGNGVAAPATLGRRDRLVLAGLVLLLPVLALDGIGNLEIFDGYLLWARQHYDLRWNGHVLPVSWLISLDAFISIGATALSIWFWALLDRRGRTVDDLWKIAIGTGLCTVAVLVLAAAPEHGVGLGWALGFHVLNDVGNTNTYMVSMALYSRLAPPALRATVTNACALQIFLGNLLVARLASRLDVLGGTRFWLTHAVLIGAAGLVLAMLAAATTRSRRRRPNGGPNRDRDGGRAEAGRGVEDGTRRFGDVSLT